MELMHPQRCSHCGTEMQGTTCTNRTGCWLHIECANIVETASTTFSMMTGTQKEMLSFLKMHEGMNVVVTYHYNRPQSERYHFGVVND